MDDVLALARPSIAGDVLRQADGMGIVRRRGFAERDLQRPAHRKAPSPDGCSRPSPLPQRNDKVQELSVVKRALGRIGPWRWPWQRSQAEPAKRLPEALLHQGR